LLTLGACSRSEPSPAATKELAPATTTSVAPPNAPAVVAPNAPAPAGEPPPSGPLVLARRPQLVHAPAGDDAAVVIRDARSRAVEAGRDLVVYVGATWCEPCQRFHKAVERGELDNDFPNLTLLEFDVDVDRERLASADYVSQLIPLFVVPRPDGRASEKRFEGSVKGDRAVTNIAPRLRAILAK
jgi:thiol-disulfide isomerase/thioredoxin